MAGSHGDEDKDTGSSQLVSSLISTRHPLDLKMKHAEIALTKGGIPLLGGEGVGERRPVPKEEDESGAEGDIETQSDSDREDMEGSSGDEPGMTHHYRVV